MVVTFTTCVNTVLQSVRLSIRMTSRTERPTLREGKLLGTFRIISLIGQGGYGDIYKCREAATKKLLALKVEPTGVKKQALQREVEIMKLLDSPYFPKFIAYQEMPKRRYLAMELLGPSFTTVRRLLPGQRFSISSVLRAGIEMLRAIEALHERGFLHRDIKPSNFLIRASRSYPLVLTDFGLSRAYIDKETGEMIPPRSHPGFVGTAKYASLNAHDGNELGRKDDLVSWFYSLIEMWKGRLPWSTQDKHKMRIAKGQTDIAREIADMPPQMISVYRLIRRMQREETPDYKLLTSFVCAAMEECGASWDDPWEWEEMDLSEVSAIDLRTLPGDHPIVPEGLPPPVVPPRQFTPLVIGGRR